MEKLIHWFSRNHVAANFVMLAVLLAGITTWFKLKKEIFPETATDIITITLLSHASGGMISGLPALLVITVAASAVLISNRTLATAIAALIQFFSAKTSVDPLHPDKASALVTSGVYSISRNPQYLALLMVLLAWGLWLGNAFNVLLAPCHSGPATPVS